MRYLLAVIVALAFVAPAAAQQQDRGFYAGASLGQSKAKSSCDGLAGTGISCEDTDTAWKVFGGYQFMRHFAVELGYSDLGEVTATAGANRLSVESSAFELVGVGILPVADRFSVFAKVGLYRADTEATSNIAALNGKENNTDLTYALGARYDFTGKVGAFLQWQRYQDVGGGDIGEDDVDVISLGVLFRF
jgi:OOP family OmpA-OmpF porin